MRFTFALGFSFVFALPFACAKADPPAPTVAAYDVSVLLPLPNLETEVPLLGFTDVGIDGSILPPWAIAALPPLASPEEAEWAWAQLRAVAVRFDPCFASVQLDASCKNEVRIVWQPVANDPKEPGTLAMDAAVHTFYAVSRDELVHAVRAVRDAAGSPDEGTLSVHPTLAKEGLKGDFAKALRAEVLRITGEKRLTRVTFMTLPRAEHEWVFGGFDVVDGAAAILKPTGVDAMTQTVRGLATNEKTISAKVEPEVGPDDPSPILSATISSVTPDVASAAYNASLRLENPRLTTPESRDCASCHLAASARRLGEASFSLTTDGRVDAYIGGLKHEAGPAQSFRAFGYFGKKPSVSARVANETAEVIRMFSELGVP